MGLLLEFSGLVQKSLLLDVRAAENVGHGIAAVHELLCHYDGYCRQRDRVDPGRKCSPDNRGSYQPGSSLLMIDLLPWILDHRNCLQFDVRKSAVDHLDTPHIFVLHDVAGIRIDHE